MRIRHALTAGAALGAALAMGAVASPAHASGGNYYGITRDSCGVAQGTYHWYATTVYNGKQAYKTDWDILVSDRCSADSNSEGLYTKYTKWNGSSWASDGDYHRLNDLSNKASDVADVSLFVCHVGNRDSCVKLQPN
ncbi:hypothetical protein ACFWBB_09840 [Streptomyces sp. NPDC060000]|uniref:hypothetical protein n=1 Tax=Streptomyces sp. NPDC060000 TaxID=3347031 RepID=UPI0036BC34B8